jgi:hypothetical protein
MTNKSKKTSVQEMNTHTEGDLKSEKQEEGWGVKRMRGCTGEIELQQLFIVVKEVLCSNFFLIDKERNGWQVGLKVTSKENKRMSGGQEQVKRAWNRITIKRAEEDGREDVCVKRQR